MSANPTSSPRVIFPETIIEEDQWPVLEALIATCFETVTTLKPKGFRAGTITVLLANDAKMQSLNGDFRKVDHPTNVLSFPAGAPVPGAPDELIPHIGDLALGYETCAREAADKAIALEDHVAHLVLHGILHLFGYDHINDREATAMEQLEIDLLGQMGIKNPYEV